MKPGAYTIIVAGLWLAACSSIRISGINKAPDFSISNYKTFGFHEIEVGGTGVSDVHFKSNLEVLKAEITKQMKLKGVTHTQSNPDLIVNIGATVDEKDQTRETSLQNPGDRRMTYMGSRNYGWESQEVVVGTYREGSVKVDLVDKNTFKLVWTGTAESILPDREKNVPAVIEEGMAKLFAAM